MAAHRAGPRWLGWRQPLGRSLPAAERDHGQFASGAVKGWNPDCAASEEPGGNRGSFGRISQKFRQGNPRLGLQLGRKTSNCILSFLRVCYPRLCAHAVLPWFSSPSALPWGGPICSAVSSAGLPSSRKMRSYWRESSRGLRG